MKLATVLAAVLVYALLFILGVQIAGLHGQIGTLQQQIRQDQAQLAAVSAKASGGHRDLITCADMQDMHLQDLFDISLNTDASGAISAVPNQQPVALPSHCINQ